MSNKVDKLFKDKLEEHSLQPSARAWEKVEAHLGKKNKMVVWLRVAAVLMLLGVLTFVGLNWNTTEPRKELVKKDEIKKEEIKKEEKTAPAPVIKEAPKKVVKKKEKAPPVIEEPKAELIEPQIAIAEEEPKKEEIKKEKGITLTYSLPAIKKQEEPNTQVAQAEPKKTGLERVLEIAREVKNSDPIGELREAKDEILALDFRKDKNKKH